MYSKAQVLKMFRSDVLPSIKNQYEQDGRVDHPARAEAWNNFTDALREDRLISNHAYETWTNPF
jgi:hypothetical protein